MQQYLVTAWDGTDQEATQRRMTTRPLHLEGARQLKANDHFIIGGAILSEDKTMIGSMMVVQFNTEDELQQWLNTEPYITANVWHKIDIRPFKIADV